MYRIVFLLVSSFLCFNCGNQNTEETALPYYNDPTFTPLFLNDRFEAQKDITHTIGEFEFLNQDSIQIDQEFIANKIHVASFIFTTCGSICPKMISNMKIANDSLHNDKDVVFLSYSVTPWIDTPSTLKSYMNDNAITNPNWQFLTGSKSSIYKLARQSYYAEEDIGFSKDSTEFLHTEHLVLVDRDKRIRGIYNGTLALDMQELVNDIRTLKTEIQ